MNTVIRTVRIVISIVVSFIAVIPAAKSDFVRQIDRPLQDRNGERCFSFGAGGDKRLHYDTLAVKLSMDFSYAVSDRVTFCDLPWPIVQVMVKGAKDGAKAQGGIDGLAISLRVGATSTLGWSGASTVGMERGYADEYIRILPLIGILAKLPLSGYFWTQCDAALSTVGDEALQGYLYPRIGCQFSRHLYGMAGYRGGFFGFFDSYRPYSKESYFDRFAYALDYYHSSNAEDARPDEMTYSSTMPVVIGADVSRHFSMIIETSIGKNTGKTVPVGAQLQIKW